MGRIDRLPWGDKPTGGNLSIVMITGHSAQWQVPDVYAGVRRLQSLAIGVFLFYAAADGLDAAAIAVGHFEAFREVRKHFAFRNLPITLHEAPPPPGLAAPC